MSVLNVVLDVERTKCAEHGRLDEAERLAQFNSSYLRGKG
jgi:hypothetical protein